MSSIILRSYSESTTDNLQRVHSCCLCLTVGSLRSHIQQMSKQELMLQLYMFCNSWNSWRMLLTWRYSVWKEHQQDVLCYLFGFVWDETTWPLEWLEDNTVEWITCFCWNNWNLAWIIYFLPVLSPVSGMLAD